MSDGCVQRRGLVPTSVAGEAAAVGRFPQNLCSWAGFSLLSTVFLSERSSRMEATISVTCLPAAVAVRLEWYLNLSAFGWWEVWTGLPGGLVQIQGSRFDPASSRCSFVHSSLRLSSRACPCVFNWFIMGVFFFPSERIQAREERAADGRWDPWPLPQVPWNLPEPAHPSGAGSSPENLRWVWVGRTSDSAPPVGASVALTWSSTAPRRRCPWPVLWFAPALWIWRLPPRE